MDEFPRPGDYCTINFQKPEGDREKALSAGCDEYDTKPINLSSKRDKMATLLEKAKSRSPAS